MCQKVWFSYLPCYNTPLDQNIQEKNPIPSCMDKILQENMSVKCIPPWTPLLYSKTGVYLFFLFLLQNIDCGYSLEGGSNVYP